MFDESDADPVSAAKIATVGVQVAAAAVENRDALATIWDFVAGPFRSRYPIVVTGDTGVGKSLIGQHLTGRYKLGHGVPPQPSQSVEEEDLTLDAATTGRKPRRARLFVLTGEWHAENEQRFHKVAKSGFGLIYVVCGGFNQRDVHALKLHYGDQAPGSLDALRALNYETELEKLRDFKSKVESYFQLHGKTCIRWALLVLNKQDLWGAESEDVVARYTSLKHDFGGEWNGLLTAQHLPKHGSLHCTTTVTDEDYIFYDEIRKSSSNERARHDSMLKLTRKLTELAGNAPR